MSGAPPLRGWPLWGRLLLISALWGSSFPVIRYVSRYMPPTTFGLARGVIAAAAMLAFIWISGAAQGLKGGFIRNGLVVGTLNGWVPNILTAAALLTLAAASAALIQSTAPLFVALLAVAFLPGERPGPRTMAGLAVGLAGIAVIIGPAALAGGGGLLAAGMMLAVALSYAGGTVFVRRTRPGSPVLLSMGQQVFGALGAGLLMLGFEGTGGLDQPWPVWLAVAWTAVMASAVPLTLYLSLVQRARATDAAMTGYLQPVFAALVGALWLGEWPEPRVLAGGAVVLAGVWLATGGRKSAG